MLTPRYAIKKATDYNNTTARLYMSNPSTGTKLDGVGYIEFILQTASHRLEDHVNIVEGIADVFGAYAFGSKPPMFTYSGMLLNNKQDDQARNLEKYYWEKLRAWKTAQSNAEVCLAYSGVAVFGSLVNLSTTLRASDESACPFQFTMLVREFKVTPSDSSWGRPKTTIETQASLSRRPGTLLVVTSGVQDVAVAAAVPEVEVPQNASATPSPATDGAAALAEARGDNLKIAVNDNRVFIDGSGTGRYLHNGTYIYMKYTPDGMYWVPVASGK